MSRHLWVVEMREDHGKWRWLPTVGARLSRQDGREELAKWRARNPGGRFRLVRYAAIARKEGE